MTFLPKEGMSHLYGKRWCENLDRLCSNCGETRLTRIVCIDCSQRSKHAYYCYECREPPCDKNYCPLGHKLRLRYKSGKDRWCDFCNNFIQLLNKKFHRCVECDFDLCKICHLKMRKEKKVRIRKWSKADTRLIE